MNKERFQCLAAAYGGALRRWPVAERGAARWFVLRHFGSCRNVLRNARRLDRLLQRSADPKLSFQHLVALRGNAHTPRRARDEIRSWFGPVLGVGLAAACVAGIGAGFAIAPLTIDTLTPPVDPAEVAASALRNPTELGDG
jgi:hypothetical protein